MLKNTIETANTPCTAESKLLKEETTLKKEFGHLSNTCISDEQTLQVIVDRVRAVTIKALMSVQGILTKAIVDTGAEVTLMSERVYNMFPEAKKPKLYKAKRSLVVAEAGREMSPCGIFDANLKMGNFEFTWPVYVAPIRDDILLGCDLIDEMDITVNTKRGIQVKDQWIECEVIRCHDSAGQVKVARAVTVPASSEFVMTGRCDSLSSEEEMTFMFEGSEQVKQRILIARSVVKPTSDKIPVKMINQSASPIKLKKGLVIGNLKPVGSIMPTGDSYDITSHEEGTSVCRLKCQDDTHQRQFHYQALSRDEDRESETTNADFSCILEDHIKHCSTGSEVSNDVEQQEFATPQHLTELFNKSSTMLDKDQKVKLGNLLLKYQDAFAKSSNDLGKCSILKHRIDTAEAAPVRQPMRRTPQAFEGEEEKYLKEQLETGVIQPSNSAWSSPIVMVRKKTGDVRVCIDYRKLNERTIKDAYPLPRIDMCLDCLSSAKIFSTIDLQSAYMQLELTEEDRSKTAFITKYGLFEYSVMPFGLCNAPSTFQRCMELVFRGLQWNFLLVYLDDIIVLASNFEEHLARLEEVFKRLFQSGLKMKPSKCELFRTEVLFLGHVVNQDGLQPNPKIIEKVLTWKEPCCVKEVQSYLGLCSYYRQYIQNFSHVAAPLTKLTKKKVKFVWDESCQIAFEVLKDKLCSAPILAYPKQDLKYILDTDASDVGIGAVLSQVQEGKERVIAYASKKLNSQQQKYSVTRRELLAVITFMNQFRHYLLGRNFLLRTDHGSLRWIFEFKDPKGQIARWLEVLAQYNFDIVHRPGSKHGNADSLSRRDYDQNKCNHGEDDTTDCQVCPEIQTEWEQFNKEVDDVVDLGHSNNSTRKERLSRLEGYCLRAFTRGQAKELEQLEDSVKQGQEIDSYGRREITAETMFMPSYSLTDIQTLQREDVDLEILHSWIDKKYLPDRDEVAQFSPAVRKYWLNSENLIRKRGILYQKKLTYTPERVEVLQLLVPKVLRSEIIRNNHDILMAGHFGVNKTSRRIKQRFHWYQMDTDIRIYIGKCVQCNKTKDPGKRPKAKMKKYLVGYPLDRLALDIMGPLPLTRDKNKFILVIGDYFTRWMEAYSLPSQHAENIAEKLVHEFISRYGTPYEIHTDQGRNFESQLFQEVLKLLEVKKTRTTAYRPSSNGLIERFNGTLGRMIKKFVDRNKSNWDKHLSLLLAAYRATPHPPTGYSPNFLMFGREVNIPSDILFPFPKPEAPSTVHEYACKLRDKLEQSYHLVRKNLRKAAERQKRDYDSRAVQNVYKRGDIVYKKEGAGKKLDAKYTGPYVILKCLSSSVYKIQGRKVMLVVHHDRLKLYKPEKLPIWLSNVRKSMNL